MPNRGQESFANDHPDAVPLRPSAQLLDVLMDAAGGSSEGVLTTHGVEDAQAIEVLEALLSHLEK